MDLNYNLFSGQSESSGSLVASSVATLNARNTAGHAEVYRFLKCTGNVAAHKGQKQAG